MARALKGALRRSTSITKTPPVVRPAAWWAMLVRRRRAVLLGVLDPALHGDAFQKALQLLAAHGVLKLAHGLGLDLPDALAGHLEDAAHLLERVSVSVA